MSHTFHGPRLAGLDRGGGRGRSRDPPDVVLMDVSLPGTGGVEAARQICRDLGPGRVRVLMLIGSESEESVFGALRAGVTGILLKDSAPVQLLDAIRVVASGEAVLAPSVGSQTSCRSLSG